MLPSESRSGGGMKPATATTEGEERLLIEEMHHRLQLDLRQPLHATMAAAVEPRVGSFSSTDVVILIARELIRWGCSSGGVMQQLRLLLIVAAVDCSLPVAPPHYTWLACCTVGASCSWKRGGGGLRLHAAAHRHC